MSADGDMDAREFTLIEKVAEALATYHGVEPDDSHRRLATALLRGVLCKKPSSSPDVERLSGDKRKTAPVGRRHIQNQNMIQ
jgi:hypothetical protein